MCLMMTWSGFHLEIFDPTARADKSRISDGFQREESNLHSDRQV
jgi:hypothetical protein